MPSDLRRWSAAAAAISGWLGLTLGGGVQSSMSSVSSARTLTPPTCRSANVQLCQSAGVCQSRGSRLRRMSRLVCCHETARTAPQRQKATGAIHQTPASGGADGTGADRRRRVASMRTAKRAVTSKRTHGVLHADSDHACRCVSSGQTVVDSASARIRSSCVHSLSVCSSQHSVQSHHLTNLGCVLISPLLSGGPHHSSHQAPSLSLSVCLCPSRQSSSVATHSTKSTHATIATAAGQHQHRHRGVQ